MQPYEIVLLIITAVIIIAITGVIISRNAKKKMYYKLLASFGADHHAGAGAAGIGGLPAPAAEHPVHDR